MSLENTHINNTELGEIFCRAKSVFFIGIGGISMSALADFCVMQGKKVFGYDSTRSDACARLEGKCYIKYCSTPDSVCGMDLVIYSTAIDSGNLELCRARELKIPTVSRANFLGYIMAEYENRIGICGMHGKSTTTAMLGHIYSRAGRTPTVFCGAEMLDFDSTHIIGRENFIFEACEYRNAFLSFEPSEAAVTNIDFDHPDFFKSEAQILDSFQKFISMSKRAYINADCKLSRQLKHENIITYGIDKKADYTAKSVHSPLENCFIVYHNGTPLTQCSLKHFGKHFIYDALCAFSVAHQNGISPFEIASALETFSGTKRRMQMLKSDTSRHIFEDYAHHPSEIEASLLSLKEMGYKRVFCIYQAHTYSRSYYLFDSFKRCFKNAHRLIVLPTYEAREENIYGISDLEFALACGGIFVSDPKKAARLALRSSADCIVLMGAGDLCSVKDFIL